MLNLIFHCRIYEKSFLYFLKKKVSILQIDTNCLATIASLSPSPNTFSEVFKLWRLSTCFSFTSNSFSTLIPTLDSFLYQTPKITVVALHPICNLALFSLLRWCICLLSLYFQVILDLCVVRITLQSLNRCLYIAIKPKSLYTLWFGLFVFTLQPSHVYTWFGLHPCITTHNIPLAVRNVNLARL